MRRRLEGWGWFRAATLVAWGVATALLVARYAGHSVDDFFVTFRYAQNLAEGQGLVFNPGERVFGLTNPGLAILLAGLHRLTGLAIPILATLVTGLSLLATALLLLREAEAAGDRAAGWIGGALGLGAAYVWCVQGGEAAPVLLLLALAATAAERRPVVAGLLAGAATWMRPDALLGVAALGAIRWIESRRPPVRFGAAAAAAIGAGVAAAWLYYGSPVPVTLESKRLLGALVGGETSRLLFWARALRFWTHFGGPGALALAALGAAGLAVLLRRRGPAGRALAATGLALWIAYPLLGVPFFLWYTIPTAFAVLYAAPLALGALDRRIAGRWPAARSPAGRLARGAVAATIALPLLVPFVQRSLAFHDRAGWEWRLDEYRQAALWIRERSAPGDAIACDEIGVVGYYSGRPLLDVMGLVSPQVFPYLARRDFEGAFLARPTRFVVYLNGRSWHGEILAARWFRDAYRKVARFPLADGSTAVQVWERRARIELPPPRPPQGPMV